MNDAQLETFITVTDCGSFSKAESVLYCSKQGLVKRIDLLEKELGFAVYARTHNGIVLTEAGKVFYNGAKQILSTKQDTLAKCRKIVHSEKKIRLSKIESHMLMDEITLKYANLYPDISIQWIICPSKNDLENVRKGLIDVGEIPETLFQQESSLSYTNLIELPYICLVHPSHPLARYQHVTLDHLKDYSIFTDFRQYREEEFSILADHLSITDTNYSMSDDLQNIYKICSDGNVLITPSYYAYFMKELRMITLELNWTRKYGLVTSSNASPSTLNYVELAKNLFSTKTLTHTQSTL
jgi:DNA-binding transcriptional LysR family regulator